MNELEEGYENRFFEEQQYDALIRILQDRYGERMKDIAECFVDKNIKVLRSKLRQSDLSPLRNYLRSALLS